MRGLEEGNRGGERAGDGSYGSADGMLVVADARPPEVGGQWGEPARGGRSRNAWKAGRSFEWG